MKIVLDSSDMKYNPEIHHRHSLRLKNYDYSKNGNYFVVLEILIGNHFRRNYGSVIIMTGSSGIKKN